MTDLSLDEFKVIGDFIYRKTGIRFDQRKVYYLNKRVGARMDAVRMRSVSDYVRHLSFTDNGTELQQLVNLITINETYFFREYAQLQSFAEVCLPDVVERKIGQGKRSLRIWCAGCSSGEEAYTLAIIMREMLDDFDRYAIDIVATDIDKVILQSARTAIYSDRSVKEVPPEYLKKYFSREGESYRLGKLVKDMVTFEHLNLSDKPALRQYRSFDFIFCRNVLIYFDEQSRKQVTDHFYTALVPGGYIFLGSSESPSRVTPAFKIKRAGDMLVYYKE
jgi:chemotaxis protein methyltransferase CheR